jgi:hypothetical protein
LSCAYELGKPTKYLTALIANYNNLAYEEAINHHHSNIKSFREQVTEAEKIYQLIVNDGNQLLTRRLILKYKARKDTDPFSEASLGDGALKTIVSGWFKESLRAKVSM